MIPKKEEKFLGLKLPLIRFKSQRTFLLFKLSLAIVPLLIILLVINWNNAGNLVSFFSKSCIDYRQKDFSRRLHDRLADYIETAKQKGITPCSNDEEIRKKAASGKLVRVTGGRSYRIDRLTHSSPYLTPAGIKVLEEIADRFREKTSDKGLYGTGIIITSMTRKTETMRVLRRGNSNASANSPHLYGNAFDITYKRFKVKKWMMTNCDHKFMKEALAEIILQMKNEGKCWATYERNQNCFHVVAR